MRAVLLILAVSAIAFLVWAFAWPKDDVVVVEETTTMGRKIR